MTDLFAGIAVTEYQRSVDWVTRLLGGAPAFYPNDREAVWQVGAHQYVYIVVDPGRAGYAVHTIFVDDLAQARHRAARGGLEPTTVVTLDNGVRKLTYADLDGNEISFGGTLT